MILTLADLLDALPGPMKWMVFTRCDDTPDGSKNPPKVLNYRFRPIHHGP